MTASADVWAARIDDLVAYCSNIDVRFTRKMTGASVADLATVAALVGHEVPEEYAEFLKTMGRCSPGDLGRFLEDVTFGIRAISDFYDDPPVPVPDDAIYLWTFGTTSEMFIRN
jgi:hypothetical protein